jgi:hypothetical protein
MTWLFVDDMACTDPREIVATFDAVAGECSRKYNMTR